MSAVVTGSVDVALVPFGGTEFSDRLENWTDRSNVPP